MPATVRDVLLMIRAKEEASKALGQVSNAMRRTAQQAEINSARARAAALRASAVQARVTGATVAQVQALNSAAGAWDRHAKSLEQTKAKSENVRNALAGVGQFAQTAGIAMLAATAAMGYGLKKAVDVASAWDRQVRLTYTQVDKRFKPSLKQLGDIGLRVSRDIATPFEKVQEALFDVFSSTEANIPQAEQLLRSFAKAAVAGQTDIQTASRATIGLMNAYQIPFKDVNKVLDIQFQLVQEGVGTYQEWAQRIGLVTPSAVRAGQSIETMAAALSTATRLGQSAARGATAVSRAFDVMSNPATENKLKKIGVATRDAKGNFRPLVNVLADWRKQLEKLPNKDRIAEILNVLKGAGSTIEARRFLQGILLTKGGLELFQNQIKEFATDKGAFQSAYDEMAGSVSAQSQLLHNKFMQLSLSIGQALLPTFIKLVNGLSKIMDSFNKLSPGTKNTIAQIALWATALGALAGVTLVVLGPLIGLVAAAITAGPALATVVGTFVGIAAGLAGAVGVIVALGAAFVLAYQNSRPFRDMILSIWNYIKLAAGVFKEFAVGLWSDFNATIMPALRNLWSVIQTNVLPAIQGLAGWAQAHLIPIFERAGGIFRDQVRPAMAVLGDVITHQVVPAIKDLAKWWEQNRAKILPVIEALAKIGLVAAAIAGGAIALLVLAVAGMISSFITVARVITAVVGGAFKFARNIIMGLIGTIKDVINWFKNLGSGASGGMKAAKGAVTDGINAIKGFFSGARTWLSTAGKDMVMGFVNGITGWIGNAASAAANMAKSAIGAAKSALDSKSPSKKFRDIGADVVRGFVLGITGNRKKVQTVMFRLSRDIKRSINAADIKSSSKKAMLSKWSKRLSSTEGKLLTLEGKRFKLQTRLAAAQKSYNNQLKVRNELAASVTEALAASNDLTSLDDTQKSSAATMAAAMKDRLKAIIDFQKNLVTLAQRGFDKQTIADLASKGVETAGAIVDALAHGSQNDLNTISSIQQQIRDMAASTGNNVADSLYKAGIQAAQGLIKGLNSQIANITKQMTAIANALVKQIKKELGIRSPSTVFDKLGVNTAKGYINGYVEQMNNAQRNLQRATMFTPGAPSLGRAASGSYSDPMFNTAPSNTKTINNHITVNTQEIDPRKTSADLGWELAGKM